MPALTLIGYLKIRLRVSIRVLAALHCAGLDPRNPISSLTSLDAARLVSAVRDFSTAWCRNGRHPACRVYNRSHCLDCGGSVSLCKIGVIGQPRPTFWCAAHCTASEHVVQESDATDATTSKVVGQKRTHSGDLILKEAAKINPWTLAALPSADVYHPSTTTKLVSSLEMDAACVSGCAASTGRSTVSTACIVSRPPLCHQHSALHATLRRVQKAGPNHGRLFFGCRGKGCEFFQWADAGFPVCACVPKRQAGLRVSKRAETGGRWFFCCRRDTKTRCNFFQWAAPEKLERLIGLLNPLT